MPRAGGRPSPVPCWRRSRSSMETPRPPRSLQLRRRPKSLPRPSSLPLRHRGRAAPVAELLPGGRSRAGGRARAARRARGAPPRPTARLTGSRVRRGSAGARRPGCGRGARDRNRPRPRCRRPRDLRHQLDFGALHPAARRSEDLRADQHRHRRDHARSRLLDRSLTAHSSSANCPRSCCPARASP